MSEFSPRPTASRSSGYNGKMSDTSPTMKKLGIDTHVPRRPGPIPSPASNSSRDSRILYAERYGLTPSMSNLADMNDGDDSDDDQPLRPMVPPKNDTSAPLSHRESRPLSVRNLAPITSTRPHVFVKPAPQQPPNIGNAPADMHSTLRLYDAFNQKVYFEGYLHKMNDLTVDGKPVHDRHWSKLYVELCGSVLTFWDASHVVQNEETGETDITNEDPILPTYINVADSIVDIVGTYQYDNPPRENVFFLSSAGSNRYFLQAPNPHVMNRWVCAIRLACYEMTKLHEIYTRTFLARHTWADLFEKQNSKFEGWIQARFGGATEWQRYWAVVTDKRDEKRLFGKKSIASRGQLMFYETKKSKVPSITIVNVLCAYAVYPENPKLINMGTMLKVEGSMYSSTTNDHHNGSANAFALLMTSSSKEIVQWLIGIFDAFKLYGRPERLLSDASNTNSLNFAEPVFGHQPRLFLEVGEIEHINVQNETLLDSKIAFAGVLRSKLEHQNRMPLPPPHMAGRTNSMPLISNVSAPQDFSSWSGQNNTERSPLPVAPAMTQSTTPVRSSTFSVAPPPPTPSPILGSRNGLKAGKNGTRYVADSSDESENGKDDEEEEEESDDDTIFRKTATSNQQPSVESSSASPQSPTESQLLNMAGFGEPFSLSLPAHALANIDSSPSEQQVSTSASNSGLKVINNELSSSDIGYPSTWAFANENVEPQQPSRQPEEPKHEFEAAKIEPVSSSISPPGVNPIAAAMASMHINSPTASDIDTGEQMTRQAVLNATARVLESGGSSKGSSEASSSNRRMPKKQPPASSVSGSEPDNGIDIVSDASYQESDDAPLAGGPNPTFAYHRASSQPISSPSMQAGKMKGSGPPSMYGSEFEHPQQRQMWDQQSMMQQQQDMYYENDDMQSQASGYYNGRMPMYPRGFFPDDDSRSMYSNMQGGEGPAIPMLGDNFVRQNSLLDMYQQEQLNAREQTEFAKATGQPLISVPTKPPEPRTGLLGLITQREQDKKDGNKAKERINMMQAELDRERMMEREQQRRMMEQRQQQQYMQAVSEAI
jgi:PH domain